MMQDSFISLLQKLLQLIMAKTEIIKKKANPSNHFQMDEKNMDAWTTEGTKTTTGMNCVAAEAWR